MEILISIAVGLICGGLTSLIFHFTEKSQGVFRINTTDPNKDVYRIEFDIPLAAISTYKTIRLKVVDDSESRE